MFRGTLKALLWITPILGGAAKADMISYSASIDSQRTSWQSAIVLPQFNPALGILNNITLTLHGHLQADLRLENLDPANTLIKAFLNGQIVLQRPDQSEMLAALHPTIEQLDAVSAYDGQRDFAGASGRTHLGLGQNSDDSLSLLTPEDLALFTGTNTVILPAFSRVLSNTGAQSHLLLLVDAFTSLDVRVDYEYSNNTRVPEPATFGLGGFGLVLGWLALRRV